jgi:hypothetical protein
VPTVAKIQIAYIPIGNGQVGAYHQFLLYTRDNGEQHYVHGGPSSQRGDFSGEASGSKSPADPSTYGNIVVQTGKYVPDTPDFPTIKTDNGRALDQKRFDSWHKQDVLTGTDADLDPKWAEVERNAIAIGQQYIPYRPLTQNSNSLASESLRRSGIDAPDASFYGLPWGGEIGVLPWAPGSNNRLDVNLEPAGKDILADAERGGSTRSQILAAALQGSKDFAENVSGVISAPDLKPAAKNAGLGIGD